MLIKVLKRFYQREIIMDIKTFVFLDCETTGLPYIECGKTRITELCLVAIQSDHLKLGVFPRVQNKLNFCYNPQRMINPESSSMTGLYNDLLEHQSSFDSNIGSIIQSYLQLSRSPICFVAHNGKNFDYPILRKHFEDIKLQLPEDILYIDSLEAFRCLHEKNIEEKPKLKDVPFEFTDGFDDILNETTIRTEEEFLQNKAFYAQKLNETTPKKNVEISKSVTHKSSSKRLNFGTSFKLCDVYSRLNNKEPKNAHKAECDVDMLIECAATLGEKFTKWANNNARKFSEIPPISIRKINKSK